MKKTYIASCYFKHNYGSMLQAYATQAFLDANNVPNETFDVSVLADFKEGKKKYYKKQIFNLSFYKAKMGMIRLVAKKKLNGKLRRNFRLRDQAFQKFENEYFHLTQPFASYNDLREFCRYNASNVIVGSDQLWLPVNVVADYYTLNFVPEEVNKIAYSTSFGVSSVPNGLKEKYTKFLSRIEHLSVREETGRKLANSLTENECTVVCDPTLLLTRQDWEKIVGKEPIVKDRYIFCYFLGKAKKHRIFAEKLKKLTGCKIISINHCDEFVRYSDKFADETPYNVGPTEWLNMIANAEYVCTDSFHGSVFSLIFNKPFFAFRRFTKKSKFSTNSRLDTLLTVAGASDRLFSGEETEEDIQKSLDNPIDFEKVNKELTEYRAFSQNFLLNSLMETEEEKEKNSIKGIKIEDKRNCCGCTACKSVCPKNAITMKEDEEGFLYPSVDQDICIDCHLCEKVCPLVNHIEETEKEQKAYLIRHNDETVLKQSTSGGAFTAFAQVVLKKGGVVFGAAFDDNYEVHHIAVDSEEDLYKFRNSKYVQSDPEDTFRQVKKYLKQNRPVLYSGTPCQIEGLKAYLGPNVENLLLVDFVCRSTPSRLVWRKYKAMRNGENVLPVAFRDKNKYGYEYSQISFKDDKRTYFSGVESDPYLRAFFSDMSVRPACYNCRFKKRYRESDLTIWDCFDIYKLDKSLDDNRGVTRCLAHSHQGEELLKNAREFATIKQINVEKAIDGVRELSFPVKMNPKREAFFADVTTMGDKELFEKWFPITMKVRIKRLGRKTLEALGIYRPVKRFIKKIVGK